MHILTTLAGKKLCAGSYIKCYEFAEGCRGTVIVWKIVGGSAKIAFMKYN